MVIHCYCYCNKVSSEVKRFSGRFIVFRDFVATLMFSLQLLLFGCNFCYLVATFLISLQLSNFLLIPLGFPYKKAAFRESGRLAKTKTFIYNLFRFSTFLVIVATFIDIIATFLIIIATSCVIIATIQFPPNSTFFTKTKRSLSQEREASKLELFLVNHVVASEEVFEHLNRCVTV